MNYKPMQSTFVFNYLKANILPTIQETINNSRILGQTELEEQFLMIKKYVNSPLKQKLMSELNQGNIKLVYAPEDAQRLTYLPFIMKGSVDGRLESVYVVISSFGNLREDGTISMDYKKLFALMESAYVAKNFMLKYDKYRNNNAIIAQGCMLYADMFAKPINKRFNIHTDLERENKIKFLAAKFYLKNVLGLQNEDIIFNNAMKACKNPNMYILKEADSLMGEEAFRDLGSFIEALTSEKMRLGLIGLNTRGYLNLYIEMYGSSTIFALELLPYFLFVGIATLHAMGLVRNFALEDIMEKGMAKILAQLYI